MIIPRPTGFITCACGTKALRRSKTQIRCEQCAAAIKLQRTRDFNRSKTNA